MECNSYNLSPFTQVTVTLISGQNPYNVVYTYPSIPYISSYTSTVNTPDFSLTYIDENPNSPYFDDPANYYIPYYGGTTDFNTEHQNSINLCPTVPPQSETIHRGLFYMYIRTTISAILFMYLTPTKLGFFLSSLDEWGSWWLFIFPIVITIDLTYTNQEGASVSFTYKMNLTVNSGSGEVGLF